MLTKASPLIALPTALLLALSLSACDEDAVSIPSTRASSSAEADSTESPKDSPKDKEAKDSDDDSSTAPEVSASADSSTGAEGDAKTVDISDLKTGNCVTEMVTGTKHGETGTTGAKVVDCSTPHQYEVIGTGQSTASSSTEANTPEEISTVCTPVLESYVGSSSTAEKYQVAALTPVQSSWDQGDHSFTCFAQNPDDTPLNNSIKNS